jgi:hypothetical protein
MEFSTAQMNVRELLTILCLLAIEALPIRDELPPVGAILAVSARHVQLFGGWYAHSRRFMGQCLAQPLAA